LLLAGFDVNIKDEKGSTPLHWACFIGQEVTVNFLLCWNASINEVD
jgi:ankyrin repeat protein